MKFFPGPATAMWEANLSVIDLRWQCMHAEFCDRFAYELDMLNWALYGHTPFTPPAPYTPEEEH